MADYWNNEMAAQGVNSEKARTTIFPIKNDHVRLELERAKILARALKCHPGVLVFPGWELSDETAA
mgnify:CR=1